MEQPSLTDDFAIDLRWGAADTRSELAPFRPPFKIDGPAILPFQPATAHWLVDGSPLVHPAGNRSPAYRAVKRAMDIFLALGLLFILAPIMLSAFVVLCFTTRGAPIFSQERVGHCGRRFRMFKFRTMHRNAHAIQHHIENEHDGPIFKNRRDPRVTWLGRILRTTSIDETPQLINVLKGDMSLVGPRPPVPSEVLQYNARQLRRLSTHPGLTCLWQVSGRSEISFDRWVSMDRWYIRHQSLWTDVKLLARTPLSVLSRRGAY